MNCASEEFVQQHITKNRAEAIRASIIAAIQTYRINYQKLRYLHSARSDASIIHDLIESYIKNIFQNDPDAFCLRQNNLFLLSINNGAVKIRFKKMDKKLRVHNIPTQQSFDFSCQQQFLFEPSININAGYVLNGLDIDVYITCPQNTKMNYWVWELKPTESTEVININQKDELSSTHRQPKPKSKEQDNYEIQQ